MILSDIRRCLRFFFFLVSLAGFEFLTFGIKVARSMWDDRDGLLMR